MSDTLNLSYIKLVNEILMGEGDAYDDATFMHQVDDLSYQATFSSFYHILAHDHPHPHSSSVASSYAHPPHQGAHAEQHVRVVNPSYASSNMLTEPDSPWTSAISTLPRNGHSSQLERGFTPKHNLSFQGHVMASHTPFTTHRSHELDEFKNSMSMSGLCLNASGLNEDGSLLPSDYVTGVQYNKNTAVLRDVVVSCGFRDALLEGLKDDVCTQAQEQDKAHSKLSSMDEELSTELAEVEVPGEDLKLNGVYTDLFVAELCSTASPTGATKDSKHIGHKKAYKGSKTVKICHSELCVFVDVREVLVGCAKAVAMGDARRSNEILQQLHQWHGASAHGTSLQRIAHFFSEALTARMNGIGEDLYRAMSRKRPSAVTLMRATKVGFEQVAFMKINQYFANQSILKAAEGASRLHIVDYGLLNGIQWPWLIRALAARKGGPPLLVITGIESPEPGVNPEKRLERSGQRLAAYAKRHNVPFQYHAIVSDKLEDLNVASLNLHKGEVLVINYIKCLHHLADESVDMASTTSPRQKLLTFLRSLNPRLLLTFVMDAAHGTPFFVSRFREALYYYSNVFDMLETLYGNIPQRHKFERSLYCSILNVVACEGAKRVERPETYKQWHARIMRAGFEQLPISPTMVSTLRSHVNQHHHREFLIHDDGKGWMLMGWKGYRRMAISAWRPSLL